MKVVLYQPQIPQNTGNVVRTCAVSGHDLMLVGPMGFSANDRWLKRAGLDYWEGVQVTIAENLEVFEEFLATTTSNFIFFSSKAKKRYCDVTYNSDDILIFGSETTGLCPSFFQRWPERFVTIPMLSGQRCLNLATTVGSALYEAWRQQNFR